MRYFIIFAGLILKILLTLSAGGTASYLYKNQEVIGDYVIKELNKTQKGYTKLDVSPPTTNS